MHIKKLPKSDLLFSIIIFILALIPRIYILNLVPPVMTHAEIGVVTDAESFLATGVLVPGGGVTNVIWSNGLVGRVISRIPVFILSNFLDNIPLNQFTARILFSLASSVFTVMVFIIIKNIFGSKVGVLAGVLMSVNYLGIMIGRTANYLNFAVAFFGVGIYLMLFQKRWKKLYSIPLFVLVISSLSNFASQPQLILTYLVNLILIIFFAWYIVRVSGPKKIILNVLLIFYIILSGTIMYRYFSNYPRSETVEGLFKLRLVSSYARLVRDDPNVSKIYIATKDDIRSSLLQYLFYSVNYEKTGDIREVNDNIMKGRYEFGKVILTNVCPVSVNAQAGEILIIDKAIPCAKNITNNSYIGRVLTAKPTFVVYNDILCRGIDINMNYKHKTSDYLLEQMDKLEFCSNWIAQSKI